MGYQLLPSLLTMCLVDVLQIPFAWKLTILALIITDIKTFPLVWHVSPLCTMTPPTAYLRLLRLKASSAQCSSLRPTLAARGAWPNSNLHLSAPRHIVPLFSQRNGLQLAQ